MASPAPSTDAGVAQPGSDNDQLQLSQSGTSQVYHIVPDATRVMSPRTEYAMALTRPSGPVDVNQGILIGVSCICPVCNDLATEPFICAQCGIYGHAYCLHGVMHEGYPICSNCLQLVRAHYDKVMAENTEYQWRMTMKGQLGEWKMRAINAIGASATVGMAVGAVAATVTGAAIPAAHGVYQGASNVVTAGANLSEVSNPETGNQPLGNSSSVDHSRTGSVRSLNVPPGNYGPVPSELSVSPRSPRTRAELKGTGPTGCDRCDFKWHVEHAFTPKCTGFPRSVYGFPPSKTAPATRAGVPYPKIGSPAGTASFGEGTPSPVAAQLVQHGGVGDTPRGTMPPLELTDSVPHVGKPKSKPN